MPVHKVAGGWKWGKHGHVYKTKAGAERQARAIYANGWREDAMRVSPHLLRRAEASTRGPEQKYIRALVGVMQRFHAAVMHDLEPFLGHITGTRIDATRWGMGLEDRLKWFIDQLETHVHGPFDTMATEVGKANLTIQTELFEGHAPPSWGLPEVVRRARAENVQLIKSAGREYAQQVQEILEDRSNWGKSIDELRDLLVDRAHVSESRATLIARDQTLKMNARMTELRQRNAGVTRYWWSTCRDERVRRTHRENEDRVFSWANPSPITGHPGHDPQCRCQAIPVLFDLARTL